VASFSARHDRTPGWNLARRMARTVGSRFNRGIRMVCCYTRSIHRIARLALVTGRNSKRFSILLAEAVADAFLGVFALFYPADDAWTLLLWIPAWAMLIGVLQILAARRAQQSIKTLVGLSGLATLLFGLCIFAWPLAVAPLIACSSLLSGVFLLAIGLKLFRSHTMYSTQQHAEAVTSRL
jgi:uncharacterized membrane protein HdeD (DUF308 family)